MFGKTWVWSVVFSFETRDNFNLAKLHWIELHKNQAIFISENITFELF